MSISKEVRLLQSRWKSGQGWPKRLEWIEIEGLRGWTGQRVEFQFPIVALVGENGVGKSTILQAVAASYKGETARPQFASDFFPDTPWEQVESATIRASIREGPTSGSETTSVRKPSDRWRGNPERKARNVEYVDLRRIQPIAARTGYARMAQRGVKETNFEAFDTDTVDRLSSVMGRRYDLAKLSRTDVDETRTVPVLSKDGRWFSGFHGGAGETAMAELLQQKIPKYSILLIDEVETSLHPRTQRRLVRDIATLCRTLELQCILTTHSPYVLDELPPEGRIYIMDSDGDKKIIVGVSPAFAMSKMDDEVYPEADVYTEDERSATWVNEIVALSKQRDLIVRYQTVPYGAANVGRALGLMAKEKRFPRPSIVFLDGDQAPSEGCLVLPGGDAPERVVFEGLSVKGFDGVAARLSRSASDCTDACTAAMLVSDHHEWIRFAADRLAVPGNVLWQGLCAEWCLRCLPETEANKLGDAILEIIVRYGGSVHVELCQVPFQRPLFIGVNK
jgi:predicted ATPase